MALNTFEGDQASRAVGVPLYYGFIEAVLIGAFLLVAWKAGLTHAPPDARFCEVICQSWQEVRWRGDDAQTEDEVATRETEC